MLFATLLHPERTDRRPSKTAVRPLCWVAVLCATPLRPSTTLSEYSPQQAVDGDMSYSPRAVVVAQQGSRGSRRIGLGGTCAREWESKRAEEKWKGEGWAGKRSRIGTEPSTALEMLPAIWTAGQASMDNGTTMLHDDVLACFNITWTCLANSTVYSSARLQSLPRAIACL